MADATKPDIDNIAKQFVDYYYGMFVGNRPGLGPLYREVSTFSCNSASVAGVGPILEKLASLPRVKYDQGGMQMSAQRSSPVSSSLLVSVIGYLTIDEDTNKVPFSQVFHLVPDETGYYVYNDILHLILG
ncbi:hypothetical protein M0805_004871 [Coniferiporia weirii]|nr:hypothetical protein M0805_004871 [Coniferiporia weirii]